MRLFVGLALNHEATEHLQRFVTMLRRAGDGLRWSPPEGWHVTLEFLGAVPDQQHACLLSRLAKISARPAQFTVGGAGAFGAGVFFADISPSESLLVLQRAVLAATAQCGFAAEDRPYHPHITLARGRGPGASRTIRSLGRQPLDAIPQVAHEFLLYESRPSPAGSEYIVRARFPLALS